MEQKIWIGVVRFSAETNGQEAHLLEVGPEAGVPNDAELAVKFMAPDFAAALREFRSQWNKHLHRAGGGAK